MIGDHSLAYFPTIGEEKTSVHCYIENTQQKDPVESKIIYLDFETYVRGYNEETKEEHDYETYAGVDLQYFLDDNRYYQPFPCVPFNIDTSKFTYQQVVN